MKIRSSETKRIFLASVFALLLFAGVVGMAYFFKAFFNFLGDEEWLAAGINSGAMAVTVAVIGVALKALRRFRPSNRATEWLESQFSDQRTARERFAAHLWLHCYSLVGFTMLMAFLAYLVLEVFSAPDSALGGRVQILVLFGLVGAIFSVSVIAGYRHLVRQFPDGETVGPARRRHLSNNVLRIGLALALLLTGLSAGATFVTAGLGLVGVAASPSDYPSDFVMVVGALLGLGILLAWTAYQCVKALWNTRSERLADEPTGGVGYSDILADMPPFWRPAPLGCRGAVQSQQGNSSPPVSRETEANTAGHGHFVDAGHVARVPDGPRNPFTHEGIEISGGMARYVGPGHRDDEVRG